MKKLFSLVLTVGLIAGVVYATNSFFSDEEKSVGNTFQAGAVDLLVDSQAHYAGLVCKENPIAAGAYIWQYEVQDLTTRPDLVGKPCDGSWALTDLGASNKFFNLYDLKPGDAGENTISLHVDNNDAYMCAYVENMNDGENGITEPESAVDTTADKGELSSELYFVAWKDDGDNIWEPADEQGNKSFEQDFILEGKASVIENGVVWPMFTPQTGALPGGDTKYIGIFWCYGQFGIGPSNEPAVPGQAFTCNGKPVTNVSQSDSLTADIRFYVEQARNNPNFKCPELEPNEKPISWVSAVGAINDTAASSKEWYMRHVGNPAPAGYSHAYQWGTPAISCDPNNTPVTFTGTIDVNSMAVGNVSLLGLLDKGLMAIPKTGYQSGAYLYVYKNSTSTVRIGPTDGNINSGELVQVFKDYAIGDGILDIAMTISAQKVNISVDGDTAMEDDYGFVKTQNNVDPYVWNEFASGAYPGWDNYPTTNYMPYNLSIAGCTQM